MCTFERTQYHNIRMRKILFLLALLYIATPVVAQHSHAQIRVFEFEEGMSHRMVSKVVQSEDGFIWLGTINGLNRFDGYQFEIFNTQNEEHFFPHDAVSDLLLSEHNTLWVGSPDHLTEFDLSNHEYRSIKIKDGGFVARESLIPYNLFLDDQKDIWGTAFDEKSAQSFLFKINQKSGDIQHLHTLEGTYPHRPILQMGTIMYFGAQDNEIWQLGLNGDLLNTFTLPVGLSAKVTALAENDGLLYVLCRDGSLFTFDTNSHQFERHPASIKTEVASSLTIEENGNLWIGGRGVLEFYDESKQTKVYHSPAIQDLVKNTCTFRQVYKDQFGVIWIATDFGAIQLVQGDRLFTNYLQGGNENCSNVFCSTRGLAEDEQGNIYISYYSSIHVLDPVTNALSPLFPSKDFFNAPFGLTYFDHALWTGNGKRIDLKTKKVEHILDLPEKDLGHVIASQDSALWIGYLHWLYKYNPPEKLLQEFEDSKGKWDSLDGNISYLHEGKLQKGLWVATLGNGLFWLDQYQERTLHVHAGESSTLKLQHNQVNVVYEDKTGRLWIGTGDGLHCLSPQRDSIRVYTIQEGMPNSFVNGILSEGDSCLWVSTDNGLSRFRIASEKFTNFFVEDGISANEFNRISFFKSRNGRMYFGGLNGINAFYPGEQFTKQKAEAREAPLLLTKLTKFDSRKDSLLSLDHILAKESTVVLSPWDRIVSFEFALADYRDTRNNIFSYLLEGYDKEWSTPSKNNEVRFHNIPAGRYTFRVRAKAKGNSLQWNSQELAVNIVVKEAFYKTWWFWVLCGIISFSVVMGFIRYRLYLAQKRQRELEALVKERTAELEAEKQKSEELLLNILPANTAEELKANGSAKAKRHELVTVMFSDFKGFSRISEHMDPEDLVAEIDHCFRAFDEIMEKYDLEKIKTVGDAYLCVGGMHDDDDGHEAVRVTMAALEIQAFMKGLAIQRELEQKPFFEARIGIHTGPVVAGIVGIKNLLTTYGATP
jgi:ligand-binding sensor domain-containing protein/class 3 adenylate cyclase